MSLKGPHKFMVMALGHSITSPKTNPLIQNYKAQTISNVTKINRPLQDKLRAL